MPASTWGVEVRGLSPSHLVRLKAAAAAVAAPNSHKGCPTTSIWLALGPEADPEFRVPRQVLFFWITWLRSQWHRVDELSALWDHLVVQLASPRTRRLRVKGPVGAAVAYLHHLGWEPTTIRSWFDPHGRLDPPATALR